MSPQEVADSSTSLLNYWMNLNRKYCNEAPIWEFMKMNHCSSTGTWVYAASLSVVFSLSLLRTFLPINKNPTWESSISEK